MSRKFDLHIATFQSSEPKVPIEGVRFAGFPLESLWSPHGMLQVLKLARFIRANNVQVVHGFMVKAAFAAVLAGAIAGAPVILTSRRNLGYHYNRQWLALTRLANRLVTRVLANSEEAKRVTAKIEGLHPDKIDVLYNGVNTDQFYPEGPVPERTAIPIPSGVRVVGIVANYRPVKDLELFLRAAAVVAREMSNVHFLLVGSGALEASLRNLAEELNIGERVIFTSGQGDVLPYLHRMCIGCLTSRSEGFSNAILEYMASGLPVVAADVGGNAEAVEHGRTGFLVQTRSPEAFAAPILQLLLDEPLRVRMGRNGLERCRRGFPISIAADRLAQYYEWLLGKPSVSEPYGGREDQRRIGVSVAATFAPTEGPFR